jgi:hypothetical protein
VIIEKAIPIGLNISFLALGIINISNALTRGTINKENIIDVIVAPVE